MPALGWVAGIKRRNILSKVYICTWGNMCVSVSVSMCLGMSVCVCVSVCLCVSRSVRVCAHVYTDSTLSCEGQLKPW